MANPSLQIGNSNWAIKEDNLLGYSTAGTKFLPQPITMTRASAGTRVNSQGLIETVELLGSEFIQDSDFLLTGTQAENVTGTYWTTGAGWTIASGVASCDGTQTSGTQLTQTGLTFTNAKTYKVTYTLTVSAGNIDARLQGSGATVTGTSRTSSGTYTDYLVSTGNTSFRMRGNTDFVGTVTNISVKEVTKNNLARVDYDGTASSLLVEPQRTNLITYSEDFSQSFWTKTTATLTTGFVAPDGTTNASKLNATANNGQVSFNVATSTTDNKSISVFAKANTSTSQLRINEENYNGNLTLFDLNLGVIIFSNGASSKMENYGNGWYKCTHIQDYAAGQTSVVFALRSQTVDSFYLWGAQLEVGSYPTSYIPTSGSTVTRVQDQYSKTGISNLINSEEGVLFVEMAALADDLTYRIISLSDGTDAERIYIQYTSTTNQVSAVLKTGSSTQANIQHTLTDETVFSKMAFKWKANDFAFWIDGVEVGTDTSGSVPSGLNRLALDRQLNTNTFFGKVKQLQVYKTALTDTELATLTTI